MSARSPAFNVRAITASKGCVGFLVVLGMWSFLSYARIIDPIFLPAPTRVLKALGHLLYDHGFVNDIVATTLRVVGGFVLAALIGVPAGLLLARSALLEDLVRPFVSFMRYIPVSGFVPLLILWVGIGFTQKVLVIVFGIVFHLSLLVADDAARTPREIIDTAKLLQVGRIRMVFKVVFPYSLPAIFDDMRIMLGAAWTYIVLAELVAANSGIGYMMIQSQRFLLTDRVIAGILTVGIIGLLSDVAFQALGRLLMPWTRLTAGS